MSTAPEDKYEIERDRMVRAQLVSRGIGDADLLNAMRTVPRHLFVPDGLHDRAYDDNPMSIGNDQTISQPYMVALMTELLEIKPTDRVLEVGTGSGYQAAVLSLLAEEVITIERISDLALIAQTKLQSFGYKNVNCVVGDGTKGWPENAPYDAIIVTASGPCVPNALEEQLAENGRLVCPVGPRDSQQLLKRVRTPQGMHTETSVNCLFVPLIGEEGWGENTE